MVKIHFEKYQKFKKIRKFERSGNYCVLENEGFIRISLEMLTIDYKLPLTQLLLVMQISKPRSHSGTLFNFSPKIVPEWLLGSKIKFLKGAILVHTFEREGAILVHKSHYGTAFFWRKC